MKRLLDIYLTTCARAKVKSNVLVSEAELVPRGIVELVNRHCIKKLVMGAVPARFECSAPNHTIIQLPAYVCLLMLLSFVLVLRFFTCLHNLMVSCSCMKMRSSRKVDYTSRKAPPFCEIWFVIKGKQAWVREAFESRDVSRARSFRLSRSSLSLSLGNLRSRSDRNLFSNEISSRVEADQIDTEVPIFSSHQCDLPNTKSGVCGSDSVSEVGRLPSSDSGSGFGKDCLFIRSNEARTDAEISKHESFWEELNCKKLELKVIEAINKVKVFESAHARQIKLRENAESELKSIISQQEKLLEEKEELSRRLQKTTKNVSLLNCHTQESKSTVQRSLSRAKTRGTIHCRVTP